MPSCLDTRLLLAPEEAPIRRFCGNALLWKQFILVLFPSGCRFLQVDPPPPPPPLPYPCVPQNLSHLPGGVGEPGTWCPLPHRGGETCAPKCPCRPYISGEVARGGGGDIIICAGPNKTTSPMIDPRRKQVIAYISVDHNDFPSKFRSLKNAEILLPQGKILPLRGRPLGTASGPEPQALGPAGPGRAQTFSD